MPARVDIHQHLWPEPLLAKLPRCREELRPAEVTA
jgi:hypothetical protein